ncbi:PREDICTED: UPF0481 protein At3g47200-like [Nelumbo nucifera]|uniref:UPF0481 protein At3g47200-like n=2 Tax=Nelumbo nucifera TaxID=4432 RepID=A0A1U7Z7V1_NELNU|nr:PREDICTED: UPF0481 protein At3g47200-like [Nelumbo nucifera]DAD29409.1 TPA_asm: hypothetical protein HUJ06_030877 [Nelumbo nucifera]
MNDQIGDCPNAVIIPIVENLNDWFGSIVNSKVENTKSITQCRIQKVPSTLRDIEDNKKYYDPQVVSIGPYHYGNPKFEEMEKMKKVIARMLVSESKIANETSKTQETTTPELVTNSEIEELYKKVVSIAEEAKKIYAGNLPKEFYRNNDELFKRVMFLDGCFVVYFIHCLIHNELKKWELKNEDVFSIGTDLFLLENQIPFSVLDALTTEAFPEDKKERIFDKFVLRLVCFDSNDRQQQQNEEKQSVHLLDLFRNKLVSTKSQDQGNRYKSFDFHYLIQRFWKKHFQSRSTGESILWHSIRSAAELKQVAGIKFKKSTSFNLDSVRFQKGPFYGELTLPPIIIDHSTKPLFLNLLAYERSFPLGDSKVASYICFLDSLIDQADDVKELRSSGVLLNFLGSDHDAAELINHLAKDLVDHNEFSHVTGELRRYTQYKWRVWVAEVRRTYFSNPWAFIGLLGAIFITILSIVQTYYSIYPRQSAEELKKI